MITIKDIIIRNDTPLFDGVLAGARLQDESQGYHNSEFGPLLNYDKFFEVKSHDWDRAIELLQNRLTEILCEAPTTKEHK